MLNLCAVTLSTGTRTLQCLLRCNVLVRASLQFYSTRSKFTRDPSKIARKSAKLLRNRAKQPERRLKSWGNCAN
eukprot:25269-Rhodomonas_salina.2